MGAGDVTVSGGGGRCFRLRPFCARSDETFHACFYFPHLPTDFPELQKDDLGAEEYMADWPTRCLVPSQVLCDAKKAADKQVMHMTAARRNLNFVPGNEHFWPVDDIERELLGALRVFLGAVPTTLVDPTALANLQQMAARTAVAHSGMITHTGYISVLDGPGAGSARTDMRTTAPTSGFHAKTQP
jgi:hypothetical protein